MMQEIATEYAFLKDIISYKSDNENGKNECCKRISEELSNMNFNVSIFRKYGSPIIYAEYKTGKVGNILFYMHYDVKPIGDLNEWKTNPFELSYNVEYNKFYARGAGDDKGQIYSVIMGIKKAIESGKDLQYNVAILLEGDEENASPGLERFSENELKNKRYDMVIVLDGHWVKNRPAICLGCRGQLDIIITYEECAMQGNCHAGNFGGVYAGAGRHLLSILENFFDDAEKMIDEINRVEDGFFRNAISLTYFSTGDANRSLIPREAKARIDIRYTNEKVVKNIMKLLAEYVNKYGIVYEIRQQERGFYNEANHKQMEDLASIIYSVTGQIPIVLKHCGAYMPLRKMSSINGIKYIIPLAQSDEHNHEPNENISLRHLEYGIEIISQLLL